MTHARPRIDPVLATLPRSTWEGLIYEANLGTEDSDMARRYFIDKQCQIDIAIDKDVERCTVSRHLTSARTRIEQVYKDRYPS